uniref:Pickpocket 23, isoform D n=1 Tax=Drosophila melanogaster TaxID=7227 RepID=M9PHF4_DROME|nr:pickpocket 23, isoform D [Drosophila melanogaster]AGB95488.1 pickpocket 23, isoform D [Drosophila melanogaster]|eukprot:NP_001259646.1 pickpocket 23, isoform D [Drosophila melanogaster]
MPQEKRHPPESRTQRFLETLVIFRRSLIYQTKEFFQNSTLHGVRYIAESGRPIGEKFMWFCFTSIGAVTALVIIMSLWEKFQTNPTITGLDTDFHNQNVVFPTTVVCPEAAFDHDKTYEKVYNTLANYDEAQAQMYTPFLRILTSLNFENVRDAKVLSQSIPQNLLDAHTIREWAFEGHIDCKNVFVSCKYRDEDIPCCDHFEPIYTEHGFCYAFNSRFKSTPTEDVKTGAPHDLYETDKKWALFFIPNSTSRIFIFSNEEYFGSDFNAQIDWSEPQLVEVRISKKNTYTTDDARQLSIGQRKCIFSDEVKLNYFPDAYTFSSCMKQCRMNKAIKLCKCNPPFYKPIPNVPMCSIKDFDCLDEFKSNITNIKDCLQCELSCSKTVFNIDKLIKMSDRPESLGVLVEFLTWPIIRYKREVLFGWVDLLVSFGGIASLFLGFSLLSGVEIIYYFTLRACCMVYKNRQELYEIEEKIRQEPPPKIDLKLSLKSHNPRIGDTPTSAVLKVKPAEESAGPNPLGGYQRKHEKDYSLNTKNYYKTPKVVPDYGYTSKTKNSWTTYDHSQYMP